MIRTKSVCRSRPNSRIMRRWRITTASSRSFPRPRRDYGSLESTRKCAAVIPGSSTIYRFPSKSYGNVEGIAWLTADTLIAVSDRRKKGQPNRCAEKDQSIHLLRIPAE